MGKLVRILKTIPHLWLIPSAKLMIAFSRQPGARLIILIWATLMFMHAYVVASDMQDDMRPFMLDIERGVSEHWEAAMLLTASALLVFRSAQRGRYGYLVPAFIVLYMAVDGWTQIHETVGHALWPEHKNAGEFSFMATVGASALGALCLVIGRSSVDQKRELTCYAILFVLFGMFGTVVDAIHAILLKIFPALHQSLNLIEDGGELLVISLMLIWSLGVHRRLGGGANVGFSAITRAEPS